MVNAGDTIFSNSRLSEEMSKDKSARVELIMANDREALFSGEIDLAALEKELSETAQTPYA